MTKKSKALTYLKENNSVIILIMVIIAAVLSASPQFTKVNNLYNLVQSIGTYGILAIGLTFVFLVGGIDLSIAYQVAFCGTIFALVSNSLGFLPGLLIALSCGVLLGYLNGNIVTRLKIPPLIGTLAVMTALNGIVLLLNNNSGSNSMRDVTVLGMSLKEFYNIRILGFLSPSMLIAVVLLVALGIFLKWTRTGANMYITGGNPEAGKFSGINNDRLTRLAYTICGLCSSICAILVVCRLNSSTYNMGDGLDITAICAVVIGGVKMQGGKGNMGMCIIGVAIMQIINNVMLKLAFNSAMQSLVTGIIVIIVLIIDKFTSNAKAS